jgi:alkylation response protein AidB-like acyl-CoA dehydrogenase
MASASVGMGEAVPAAAPSFEDLLAAIAERRANFQVNRKVDREITDLMKQVGVYRALVAKRFGGDEESLSSFFRKVERIAAVDGSAGWVASFGVAAIYLTALPLETLRELYANGPDIAFAGGNLPSQEAFRVDGGLRINGRWSWGSGCSGADVIGVGIEIHDPEKGVLPMMGILPKSKVVIEENWNVSGMRGTGSFDLRVDNQIIPEGWTFVRGAPSNLDEPLYRYPVMAVSSQALSLVNLGIARGAIDELIAMAKGRTSLIGGVSFANRPSVQIEIAKAEALLRSARAYFYEVCDEAYARCLAGDIFDDHDIAMLRLAGTNAAHAGFEVVRRIYTIAGTTGIYNGTRINQAMLDAMVIPQHAFIGDTTWQIYGASLLDVPPAGL